MNWRTLLRCALLCTLMLTLALPGAAQEAAEETPAGAQAEMAEMMAAMQVAMTPGEEHAHLAETVGEWHLTLKMWMDPNTEAMVNEATATRKMTFGGRHLEETVTGNIMGMPFEGRALTGYDNVKGEYWSTWVDNMSTGIAIQRGNYDEDKGAMVMSGHFADPMTGEDIPVRSEIRSTEDREEVVFWETRGGQEVKTMELVYTRGSGNDG